MGKREIKFRAWHEGRKVMQSVSILGIEEGFTTNFERGYMHNSMDWIYEDGCMLNPLLMQYTGLKDKNGKEIYEGDIVKCGDVIGLVEYINCGFQLQLNENNGNSFFVKERAERFEVIGNAYESPDLLSQQS